MYLSLYSTLTQVYNMDKETLEHLLCISGYLPPRNEEELMEFEKECDKVEVKQKIHIDIDKITKQ